MNSTEIEWDDGRKLSRNKISDFERIFGFDLPNDYKEVIKDHDGGNPSLPALDFCGMVEKVFSGLIPLIESNDFSSPIIEIIERYEGRFPKDIIPIGDDPFGNIYCFDYRKGSTPTIVYWDHEMSVNDNKQFCHVANNFTELLRMLYLPKD